MKKLVAMLVVLLGAGAVTAAPTPREVMGSELLVKEYLEKLDVPSGQIRPLHEERLTHVFPNYLFFVATYPPAAAANLPEPLKPVNVFAVDPDGQVKLLTGPDDIVALFKVGFDPGKDEPRCKVAVRAILLLLKAWHPDYEFVLPEDLITIAPDGKLKKGVGKLVVKKGPDKGVIDVVVTLDKNCDPLKVVQYDRLKPSQVTFTPPSATAIEAAEKVVKATLVDAKLSVDPVKFISDPLVVRTFPGYLLFVVPQADPKQKDPLSVLDVMIVGPSGDPQRLFGGTGGIGRWFNATFGPATTDPRLKESAQVLVRLVEATRPGMTFGPAPDPEITVEDGIRTVFNKVTATGPGGRKWLFTMKLTYGRKGKLVAWSWGLRPVKD